MQQNGFMTLPSGEIYFIRELDLLTNDFTEYFKVGIVRDGGKDKRSSENRLKDHQTGNPRKLVIDEVFKTPLVERIETMIHAINASSGIRGEWLRTKDNNLELIKEQLRSLVGEAQQAQPVFEEAELISKKASNGEVVKASDIASEWFAKYSKAHLSDKYFQPLVDRISDILRNAIEKGEDLDKVAKIQEQESRFDLDQKALKEAHPELYALFVEVAATEPKGRFSTKKISIDQDLIDNHLAPLTSEVLQVIEKVESGNLDKVALHKPALVLYGLQARAAWDKDVAGSNLQILCGVNSGIEGICTWNREEKKVQKFNKKAFIEAHPEIAAKFQKEIAGKSALIVDKKIGYAE